MTDQERHEVWNEAADWGYTRAFNDLLHGTDKASVILVLFRRASEEAAKETDPIKKAMLEGYSEGFRHSINMLENLGTAFEMYQRIINPSIKVTLTEEDVKRLR